MKSSGPQSDRDRMWSSKSSGMRDDILGRREQEQATGTELSQMRSENKALRDQIARAMKELRAYQVKYPSPYVAVHNEDDPDASLWAARPEVMTPLLEAYDTRILELEDSAAQQAGRLEDFRNKIELLVKENEELRSRFLDLDPSSSPLSSNPLQAELLSELHDKLSLLLQENALLGEQKRVLAAELDSFQALCGEQQRELSSLRDLQAQLQGEAQRLSQIASQLERERDEAAGQALGGAEALGRAEQELDNLTLQLEALRAQRNKDEGTIVELRRQVKLLSGRYQEDLDASFGKVRRAEERARELQGQLLARSRDLDAAQDSLRKMRGEYKATRGDAEGMLQVMTGMERQLGEYAAREEQVAKLSAEARERLEEAELVRERAEVKEREMRREVERLHAERRAFSLARQEEVEQLLEKEREVWRERVGKLERELEGLVQKVSFMSYEREKSIRDAQGGKDLLSRHEQTFSVKMRDTEEEVERLREMLRQSVEERERESAGRREMQEQNRELRLVIDKLRGSVESGRGSLHSLLSKHEGELAALRAVLGEREKELQERGRLSLRQQKEIERYLLLIEEHKESGGKRGSSSLDEQTLVHKLKDTEQMVSFLQRELNSQEVAAQEQIGALREKYRGVEEALERKRREEGDKNRALLGKLKALELKVGELEEQREGMERELREKEGKLRVWQEECRKGEEVVRDLSQQLVAQQYSREQMILSMK